MGTPTGTANANRAPYSPFRQNPDPAPWLTVELSRSPDNMQPGVYGR